LATLERDSHCYEDNGWLDEHIGKNIRVYVEVVE